MKRKLTLRMDEDAIAQAKEYAHQRGMSVSKLVQQFFEALEGDKQHDEIEISPFVKSLRGVVGQDVSEDDYYDYLERKHQ